MPLASQEWPRFKELLRRAKGTRVSPELEAQLRDYIKRLSPTTRVEILDYWRLVNVGIMLYSINRSRYEGRVQSRMGRAVRGRLEEPDH